MLPACKCLHFACLYHCWSILTQGCVPDIGPCGSVSRNTVPRAQYTPKGQEVYHVLDDMIFEDHAIQYHHCCQLISKNTSLQCGEYWQCQNQYYNDERMANIQASAHGFMSKTWFPLIPDTRNTRWFWKLIGYGSGIEKYFGFGSGIGYPLVPALGPSSALYVADNCFWFYTKRVAF